MHTRLPKFLLAQLSTFLSVGILVLLALIFWRHGLTICPFRLLTGLPCLSCGMTHAWVSFGRGELALAFQYHPCFLLAVPAFLTLVARQHKWGEKLWHSRLYWLALLLSLVVCYVWRMIKYFPDGHYPMIWADKSLLSMLFRISQNLFFCR